MSNKAPQRNTFTTHSLHPVRGLPHFCLGNRSVCQLGLPKSGSLITFYFYPRRGTVHRCSRWKVLLMSSKGCCCLYDYADFHLSPVNAACLYCGKRSPSALEHRQPTSSHTCPGEKISFCLPSIPQLLLPPQVGVGHQEPIQVQKGMTGLILFRTRVGNPSCCELLVAMAV